MMSATVANSPYSRPYPDLKRYLRVSGICHVVLIGLMVLSAFFKWPGNQWAGAGGGGDNIKVNLVGSAGIPMPKQPVVTESNVVDRHIRELRVKLKDDWRTPRYIETVAGAGYRFKPQDGNGVSQVAAG